MFSIQRLWLGYVHGWMNAFVVETLMSRGDGSTLSMNLKTHLYIILCRFAVGEGCLPMAVRTHRLELGHILCKRDQLQDWQEGLPLEGAVQGSYHHQLPLIGPPLHPFHQVCTSTALTCCQSAFQRQAKRECPNSLTLKGPSGTATSTRFTSLARLSTFLHGHSIEVLEAFNLWQDHPGRHAHCWTRCAKAFQAHTVRDRSYHSAANNFYL